MSLKQGSDEQLVDGLLVRQELDSVATDERFVDDSAGDAKVVGFIGPKPESEQSAHTTREKLGKVGRVAVRCAGGLLAVALPPMAGVVATEILPPAHTSIVGLDTTSRVKIGHDSSRLNLGLPGSITTPAHKSFFGINLGMDASVQGDGLNFDDSTTRNAIGEILGRPQPEIDRIVKETEANARKNFLLGAGAALSLEVIAGGIAVGRRLNYGKDAAFLQGRSRTFNRLVERPIMAGSCAAAAIGISACGLQPIAQSEHAVVIGDPTLEDTALKGYQLKGGIGYLAPTLINGLTPSEKDSDRTSKKAIKLVHHRPAILAQLHQEGWTTYEQVDDLQDRSSMAQQAGVLAKALGVKSIVMTGDWSTISQLGFGSYLMDTLNHYSDSISTWMTDGDHDTPLTDYYASLADINVADNKTHDVDGLPMLFLNSSQISTLGVDGIPTLPRDPNVSTEKATEDAANEICETHPVIVALHDYQAAKAIAEAVINKSAKDKNCTIPFFDTGRSFEQLGAISVSVPGKGTAIMFVSGSSGAHNTTDVQFGNIPIDAPVNIFAVNKATHEVDQVTFTYHPDGTVTAPDTMAMIVPPQTGDNIVGGKATDKQSQNSAGADFRHGTSVISRSQSHHQGSGH